MDEFAVLGNEHLNYSWGPIGVHKVVSVGKRERTFHCCVAMSEYRCEGIQIKNEPFTSESFTSFLKTHLKRYNEGEIEGDENIILVFDNARQHLAKAS